MSFKTLFGGFFIFALLGLTGCASIVNGTKQNVSVNTSPYYGAQCTLQNDKGRWNIPNTPGSTVVKRSYQDLYVMCKKPGLTAGQKVVQSKTKAMAFGNLVFGGVIGGAVDVANGAAYDYPSDIFVPMRKKLS